MTVPGFCNQCGRAAVQEAIRCDSCNALLPVGDERAHPRKLARDLAAILGDGYEVAGELGHGGFARVLKVKDLTLDRWLAAKIVKPELTVSDVAMERFRREAATVTRLVHPNVVPILFVRTTDEFACYVMPLVEGETLAARLEREGALPVVVAASIVQDIAAALDAAHAIGVVHRDVKPDNILLEAASGRALLTDFGIALAADATGRLTSTGFVLGTPQYIAPEQAAGERGLDARTDLYSLGVVAYEMLAGVPPFQAPNPQALYALHVIAPVPDVRSARPDVPEAAARALVRALAKAPGDRFAGAGEFAATLAAGLGRRSLRTSHATVVEQMAADDVRLFQSTSAGRVADPAAALAAAEEIGALRDALAAARAAALYAIERGAPARAAELVNAAAARRLDPRPALRKEAEGSLRGLGAERALVDGLAHGWLGAGLDAQPALEQALAALLPAAGPLLADGIRRERRAELVLLADRAGALTNELATALAADASPAIATLLVAATRETQRPAPVVERWLAGALRHPHPEVRRQALEAAAQRGGALAERLGRLGLGDREATVRLAAVATLAASGRREVVAPLAALLEHGREAEQLSAVAALAGLRVPEAEAALQRAAARKGLLGLRPSAVASAAARALRDLGHAVPPA